LKKLGSEGCFRVKITGFYQERFAIVTCYFQYMRKIASYRNDELKLASRQLKSAIFNFSVGVALSETLYKNLIYGCAGTVERIT
jgi:hypothetical protein